MADPMNLNVIGMAIETVWVVDGEHIGINPTERFGQTLSGLLDVGLPETVGVLVRGLAHHP
jgi:hypothetical protein